MEESGLLDKELKVMIIKMLTQHSRRMNKVRTSTKRRKI